MQRQHVTSSNIESVGYEAGVLEVAFHSGGIYQYRGVPEGVYLSLMSASSHGSYFNDHVKDKFNCVKIR
jgi:hypothetical protein